MEVQKREAHKCRILETKPHTYIKKHMLKIETAAPYQNKEYLYMHNRYS